MTALHDFNNSDASISLFQFRYDIIYIYIRYLQNIESFNENFTTS